MLGLEAAHSKILKVKSPRAARRDSKALLQGPQLRRIHLGHKQRVKSYWTITQKLPTVSCEDWSPPERFSVLTRPLRKITREKSVLVKLVTRQSGYESADALSPGDRDRPRCGGRRACQVTVFSSNGSRSAALIDLDDARGATILQR